MGDRDDFWDDAVKSLDNATITSSEESQDPAVSRSKNIAQDKRKQLMLMFLMGTHPRVGKNSDIQILSLGRCPDRTTDPLNIICGFLLKADDQAVYLKDLEKYPSKINDYVFEKRIGKGTYGKVYLGVHRRTGHEVAIKALNKKKIAAQKMTDKARPPH